MTLHSSTCVLEDVAVSFQKCRRNFVSDVPDVESTFEALPRVFAGGT